MLPLIYNDLAHFISSTHETVNPTSGRESRHSFPGSFKSYNLFDSQNTVICKDYANFKRHFCPRMLIYSDKVAILDGDLDADARTIKLTLYHITANKQHAYGFSWEPICSSWKISALSVELRNAACVSYENDGVALVSIPGYSQVNIYLLSSMRTAAASKNWKNGHIKLPDPHHNWRHQIQSCVVISNYMYCSLLVQERAVCIYKINLTPLKRYGKETLDASLPNQKIDVDVTNSNLRCCFLSILNEKLIAITSEHVDNTETLIEVKQFDNLTCKFPDTLTYRSCISSQVKVVTMSIVPGIHNTVVVIYHNSALRKCFVKKITIQ